MLEMGIAVRFDLLLLLLLLLCCCCVVVVDVEQPVLQILQTWELWKEDSDHASQ